MTPINVEWLNQNAHRSYPFKTGALRRPTVDGSVLDEYSLPFNAIVDMVMTTNFDPLPQVYLSSFTLTSSIVSATISNSSNGELLAKVSVERSEDEEYIPVNFTGVGMHDDIRGTLVFGDINRVADSMPNGVYEFEAGETPFETRCVRPALPCVSGIYIQDVSNNGQTVRLRGDVALVAGSNIRLEFDQENNAIVINAVDNSDFSDQCTCVDRTPIRTINGVNASNVIIEGDGNCVNVTTSGGKIMIEDTCSAPNCGCSELTFLNLKVGEMKSAVNKLESYIARLDARMNELSLSMALLNSGS